MSPRPRARGSCGGSGQIQCGRGLCLCVAHHCRGRGPCSGTARAPWPFPVPSLYLGYPETAGALAPLSCPVSYPDPAPSPSAPACAALRPRRYPIHCHCSQRRTDSVATPAPSTRASPMYAQHVPPYDRASRFAAARCYHHRRGGTWIISSRYRKAMIWVPPNAMAAELPQAQGLGSAAPTRRRDALSESGRPRAHTRGEPR
ncbi:hypothetical protein B0H67DRAFT_564341 [Lasiosphaeris hirsuta]|uniref:Uncharacterized protein n=1 Tax=Lasiosphaeris hirsuta TaxID=260670 RepID=A0AA40BBK1_9PEZI|nr:hypothetical protein B0H67DRAFT_564341 [Lasiosphaeris hirsuta]